MKMAFLRLEYLSNARLIYLLLNFIKIYVICNRESKTKKVWWEGCIFFYYT
jgi:hypothetical protein